MDETSQADYISDMEENMLATSLCRSRDESDEGVQGLREGIKGRRLEREMQDILHGWRIGEYIDTSRRCHEVSCRTRITQLGNVRAGGAGWGYKGCCELPAFDGRYVVGGGDGGEIQMGRKGKSVDEGGEAGEDQDEAHYEILCQDRCTGFDVVAMEIGR